MTLFLERKYAQALIKIQELENQLHFIYSVGHEDLELSYDKIQKIDKYIDQRKCYKTLPEFNWLPIPHFKFITITFDPQRFGINNDPDKEKNYILWHLTRIQKQQWCTTYSGCFEKQKNGTIHAHLIMGTNYEIEVYKYLKKQFTNNPNNRVAIRIDPAKTKAMEYIRKESDHYFQSKRIVNFDKTELSKPFEPVEDQPNELSERKPKPTKIYRKLSPEEVAYYRKVHAWLNNEYISTSSQLE